MPRFLLLWGAGRGSAPSYSRMCALVFFWTFAVSQRPLFSFAPPPPKCFPFSCYLFYAAPPVPLHLKPSCVRQRLFAAKAAPAVGSHQFQFP